jgi:imidazolonepropionase-like amidohydrolase
MMTTTRDICSTFERHIACSPRLTLCLKVGGFLSWKDDFLQQSGPTLLLMDKDRILAVVPAADVPDDWRHILNEVHPHTAAIDFSSCIAAPGLIEGHAHLFLSPDIEQVSDVQQLQERAFANAQMALRHGTMWLRDCGDPHGINLTVRNKARSSTEPMPRIRACGAAIHRRKRYGKQLGIAVDNDQELLSAAKDRIAQGADDVKLILSGIVNFDKAEVPGEPQFSVEAVRDVVKLAHDHGKRVVAHASGQSGTAVGAAAGVDSVEHAYFVEDQTLALMAEKRITWLPTLAPVHAQWRYAERYGHALSTRDNLRRILDGHAERINRGLKLGVQIAGGSDSGSPGVGHGSGIVDEFILLADAGMGSVAAYAACSWPGAKSIGFTEGLSGFEHGASADFVLLSDSPLEHPGSFTTPRAIVRSGRLLSMCNEMMRGVS